MNTKKNLRVAIIWIFIHVIIVYAQDSLSRQELFDELKLIEKTEPLGNEYVPSHLNEIIEMFNTEATGAVSDSMRIFFENIADNPFYEKGTRQSAVETLRLFPQEFELDRMRRFLVDAVLQIQAAGVLIEWGYWDEGSPILIENEGWRMLLRGPRPLVEPVLISAASGESKTILGQISAAMALREYHDNNTYLKTARNILTDYLIRNKSCIDSFDLGQALSVSLELIGKEEESSDIFLMKAGLYSAIKGIRRVSVRALGYRAKHNSLEAVEALNQEVKDNPYQDVVEWTQKELENIDPKGVQK